MQMKGQAAQKKATRLLKKQTKNLCTICGQGVIHQVNIARHVRHRTDLDRVEIYENILKLSQEEEARGHTLSARNSVCKEK